MKMRIRILVVALIALFLVMSCEKKEKSFKDEALELIEEVEKKNHADNQSKLAENNFSEGVREVMEWFDYVDPIIADYAYVTIRSTEEFNALKKHPEEIKAIYLDSYDTTIAIDDISVFKNLEFLQIRSLDSVPSGFYKLNSLKAFITMNDFKYRLSSKITNLENLEYLESRFTNIELPPEISKMKKLKAIKMYNFSYNQPFQEIYKVPNLKTLWLQLSSEEQLRGISNLKTLDVFVTNKISAEVGQLNLKGLIISGNSDTTFPPELAGLKTLVAFKWQTNYEATTAPGFVSGLENLEYIEFRGCQKFSHIPEDYVKLSRLKRFDIYYNKSYTSLEPHLKPLENVIEIQNH